MMAIRVTAQRRELKLGKKSGKKNATDEMILT